jgi:N-acetylglucosaminyl-diphospho-decaprenol L-rhamnosyltransferase
VTDVSIVIVSYNSRADLERCLASLHEPSPEITHEIIVVDNASSDGSAGVARRWRDVRVIVSDVNRGFAAASNIGIRAGAGDLVLLLNSDTIVPAGATDALVRELRSRPDVAVIGPRLVDATGRPELSFGRMISPLSEWRQKRLVRGLERRDVEALRRVEAMTRQEQWPDWVSGACLLVRRDDAETVGLIDERYFMYMEDVDFCAAIRAQGRQILFTPAVEIVHLRGRSAAFAPSATSAAYRRSQLAFYKKHHPAFARLLRVYLRLRGVSPDFSVRASTRFPSG